MRQKGGGKTRFIKENRAEWNTIHEGWRRWEARVCVCLRCVPLQETEVRSQTVDKRPGPLPPHYCHRTQCSSHIYILISHSCSLCLPQIYLCLCFSLSLSLSFPLLLFLSSSSVSPFSFYFCFICALNFYIIIALLFIPLSTVLMLEYPTLV